MTQATRDQITLISAICDRALEAWNAETFQNFEKIDIMMDVEFANKDCPMDLQKLLDSNGGDFFHDMAGIHRNLNRETKKLENCFVPRSAYPECYVASDNLSGL